MTYLAKPKFHHPSIPTNALGFTRRDYEGAMSTLCAGCGHDSISAAIMRACFELDLPPHRIAKLSGIGCSSKTPTYIPRPEPRLQLGARAHALGAHRRQSRQPRARSISAYPATATRASIGLGQFAHAMRRGVRMVYIVENNGVYGLTKGQFSATADRGSKSKKGVATATSRSTLRRWPSSSARRSSRAAFRATRRSWCR